MRKALVIPLVLLLGASGSGAVAGPAPDEGEPVLGISFRGAHQAYPLSLFARRRVINDVVGRQEVVVFHDPERDISGAYVSSVHGEPIEFAQKVSGTLAEDLTTVTRWDLRTGEAVAGNLVGQHLIAIPLRRTTWAAWKAAHPGALLFTAADNLTP